MLRVLIGSLVAAVVTMVLGWVFFGSPLMNQGYRIASATAQSEVLAAVKSLPESGTYIIPYGDTPEAAAAAQDGMAVVQVNREGVARQMDPMTFVRGYVHMAISFLLFGFFLYMLRGSLPSFGARLLPVLLLAGVAVVWTRLGQPIWFHTDWRNAIYLAVTDFLSLAAGGLIVSAFIPRPHRR